MEARVGEIKTGNERVAIKPNPNVLLRYRDLFSVPQIQSSSKNRPTFTNVEKFQSKKLKRVGYIKKLSSFNFIFNQSNLRLLLS